MQSSSRLRAGAVETVKVGPVDKRRRAPLGFKQAPEAAVLPLGRAKRLAAVDADVVLPAAVNHGRWEEDLRGPGGATAGQRDFQQGVKAVKLAPLHQHTHTEGLVPLGLLGTPSLGLGGGGEDV